MTDYILLLKPSSKIKCWFFLEKTQKLGSTFFLISYRKNLKKNFFELQNFPPVSPPFGSFLKISYYFFRKLKANRFFKIFEKFGQNNKKKKIWIEIENFFRKKDRREKNLIRLVDLKIRASKELVFKRKDHCNEDPLLVIQIRSYNEKLENFLNTNKNLNLRKSTLETNKIWNSFLNFLEDIDSKEKDFFSRKQNKKIRKNYLSEKKIQKSFFKRRSQFWLIFRFFNHFFAESKEGLVLYSVGKKRQIDSEKKLNFPSSFRFRLENTLLKGDIFKKKNLKKELYQAKAKWVKVLSKNSKNLNFFVTEYGNFFLGK